MKTPDYIGSGLAFPLSLNLQGNIKLSRDDDNIQESIRIILGTDIGERVYRPDFGSRLSELVFRPLNRDTLLELRLRVEEALEKWEPRIVVRNVLAEPDPILGKVDLTIEYQLRNSPDLYETRNLVYPFYLSQ
ncbi:GPW/gp25 family protein [Baaleninema sp.]|uniref:GPW/gp25 family protein n=1 Tax=Baaleninema sp. TaxID=3101197 RepID=UPI003D0169BD